MIAWTPKEHRSIKRLMDSLFSPKVFITTPTRDYFNNFRNLASIISINGKQYFLSPKTRDLYTRLTDIIIGKAEISAFFTRAEVFQQIVQSHKDILTTFPEWKSDAYIDSILSNLRAQNKDYKFLVPIEGIKLKDIDQISIGTILITRCDKSILSEVQLEEDEEIDFIYDQVKSEYWIIGEAHGGPERARQIFERSTKIAVGILAIYGAALVEGAFRCTKINAKQTAFNNRSSAVFLRWVKDGGQLSTTRSWGDQHDFAISRELLDDMAANLFFNQIAALTSFKKKSELREALSTAILWFYDAYQDQSLTMKFIKLWTCSECFFSSSKKGITDDNATGISIILAYAGYQVISPEEYSTKKAKIKKLYDLRSKALHNADLEHITYKNVDEFAYLISWLIITLFSLSEQGYTTLKQVKKQIDHLATIEAKASESTQQSSADK